MFDYGYADLNPFFQLVPWIFIFLIPAVTMRSFSDEKKLGTLELLLTRPITKWQLVFGKFLGAFILIIIALIPTLVYLYAIDRLGNPEGNYDLGIIIGSYLGLLFLASTYISIGIFASTLSENQIVSFLVAVFLCFIFYFGLDALAEYNLLGMPDHWTANLGMRSHFESISRGVVDTRDLIYFISLTILFLYITKLRLKASN